MNLGTHGSGINTPTWKKAICVIVGLILLALCCSPMYAQQKPIRQTYFTNYADSLAHYTSKVTKFTQRMLSARTSIQHTAGANAG